MPGSGGGKTSTSSSQTSSPFAPLLANMGMDLFKMSKPALSLGMGQTTEALQTGGVNARIPSINTSMAAARQGAAQSGQRIRQQLAQSGLAGSSFGNAILSAYEGDTGQTISGIPSREATAISDRGLGMAGNLAGMGIGGVGRAAGIDTKTTGTQTPSFWDMFMQGMAIGSNAAAGGAGMGGGTP